MPVDNRTPNFNLPLPDPTNTLGEDVLRITSSLQTLDELVFARATKTELNDTFGQIGSIVMDGGNF